MRLTLKRFSCLLALALVGFSALPFAQAEGTTSSINSASFTGITVAATNPRIDLDRQGTVVAAIYLSSSSAILFSYSLDSGATWTHRATGLTGNIVTPMNVIVVSATTYYVVYAPAGDATQAVYRTTDSGLNWAFLTSDAGLCIVPGITSCTGTVFPYDVTNLGSGNFAYAQVGGGAPNRGFVIRVFDSGAVLWRTAYAATINDPSFSYDNAGFTLNNDWLSGTLYYHSGSGGFKRQVFAQGVNAGGASDLDDSFSALTTRATPIGTFGQTNAITTICAGSPSRVYALVPNGGAGLVSYNTGALCSAINSESGFQGVNHAWAQDGNRIAFLTSESTSLPLQLWASCTGGTTWARTELAAPGGTSPNYAALIGVGETKFLAMFRFGASGIAVVTNNVDPTTCTGSPVGGGSGQEANPGFDLDALFCSARTDLRYGYNYEEGVDPWDTGFGNAADFNIDHGFLFNGDTNNYDYLAKLINPISGQDQTTGLRVVFKIESAKSFTQSDDQGNIAPGGESVFRAGFSLIDPYAEGWVDTMDASLPLDSDAKGDGGDPGELPASGSFMEFIEVRFEEEGDDWEIRVFLYQSGVRYQLGPVVYIDDPDVGTTYAFDVDTNGDAPYYKVRRVNEETFAFESIFNDALEKPLTAAAHPNLPAGLFPSIADYPLYTQWFVGASTTVSNAWTILDNGNRAMTAPSTCIYDFYGQSVAGGSQGSSGPDSSGGGSGGGVAPPTTTSTTTGTSLSDVGFRAAGKAAGTVFGGGDVGGLLFMTVLVCLCFGVGFAAIAAPIYEKLAIPAFGVGVLAGFGYSVFSDMVPGLVTFLLCAAAVGLGIFRFRAAQEE